MLTKLTDAFILIAAVVLVACGVGLIAWALVSLVGLLKHRI